MATKLELQAKRNALVAKSRAIHDLAAKEKREMTATETVDFNKFLDESDAAKREIDGHSGSASERLANATRELGTREGRRVPPEQLGGEARVIGGSAMRFRTDNGEEVRALRSDESFASANIKSDEAPLPDGIRPEELSLGRWIRAAITKDWSKAQAEKRAMGGAGDVGGGVMVPFALSSDFIDLARNKTVIFKAGAQVLPMESAQLRIAKLLADVTPSWKIENALAGSVDAQFGGVTLTARTLMGLAVASVELIDDARNFEALIEHSLSMAIGLELDRAALLGDGTNASPIGIFNTLGVGSVSLGTNGAALTNTTTFNNWSKACQLIVQANGIPRTTVFAPRTWEEIDILQNTLNDAIRPPDSWNNLDKLITNQIPITQTQGSANTCSCSFVGDFEQMIVGMRANLMIEISRFAGDSALSTFRSMQVAIRAFLRADIALARPAHFTTIVGIL
jgi:HK97 family phage major capsid protein